MENKKFVVWDWNGTLLDDAETVLACVNISLGEMACAPLSMERFREVQAPSLRAFYKAVGIPEENIEHALACERDLFHDHYEPRATHVPLRKGAKELLGLLKKQRISSFILSNHIGDQIVRLLELHRIHTYFDDVLAHAHRNTQFREATKGEKLRQYLKEKDLDPLQALIVGDTREEIEIARDFGMKSVAITGGLASEEKLRATKPDALVHALSDMPPVLKAWGFVA